VKINRIEKKSDLDSKDAKISGKSDIASIKFWAKENLGINKIDTTKISSFVRAVF